MCSASVFVKKSNIKGNIPPKYNEIRRFGRMPKTAVPYFPYSRP